MNNTQFRRLVLDTPTAKANGNKDGVGATPRRDGISQPTLGSRMRSSIPMTPYVLHSHRLHFRATMPLTLSITDVLSPARHQASTSRANSPLTMPPLPIPPSASKVPQRPKAPNSPRATSTALSLAFRLKMMRWQVESKRWRRW